MSVPVGRRRRHFACAAFAIATTVLVSLPAAAGAAGLGTVAIYASGLPARQLPTVTIVGGSLHRSLRDTRRVRLAAGTYTVEFKPVRVRRTVGRVLRGATAYPAKGTIVVHVRTGRLAHVHGKYSSIVNPRAKPLPKRLLGVIGAPTDPSAIVLPGGSHRPRLGTIFASGPTKRLPFGLLSEVTRATRRGSWLVLSLKPAPVVDVTPELAYEGGLELSPVSRARATPKTGSKPLARVADACEAPKLLDFGGSLDAIELRRASVGFLKVELTLAVRTTESLGVAAAAASIDCSWEKQLPAYTGALPVGPLLIPVYATFPLKASIDLDGSLQAGQFNVASTTVASVALGLGSEASLTEQGTNVWVTGDPSLDGSVKLGASVGVQAGIGVAKDANVHVEADFGPELSWATGKPCSVVIDLGSLTAGVEAFGHSLTTPAFTVGHLNIWSGCQTSSPPTSPSPPSAPTPVPTQPPANSSPTSTGTSGGSGGGGGSSTGGGSSGGGTSSAPTTYAETSGSVVHTWTDYANAGGDEGQTIPSNATVEIACKVTGFAVADGNTWWYRIASSPWDDAYYASADAFYNDGATSGSLLGTPFVDPDVPNC